MADNVTTAVLEEWLRRFALLVAENRDYLTELDSAIGDADHGSNMDRGMKAAVAAFDETPPATAGALFTKVGMTLVSTVGGASGPLFGTFFLRMGTSFGDAETRRRRSTSRRRCVQVSAASSREARPSPATRRCTTRWPPPLTPWTVRSATSRSSRQG